MRHDISNMIEKEEKRDMEYDDYKFDEEFNCFNSNEQKKNNRIKQSAITSMTTK